MTKRKVGLDEASRLLGISKEALRKRATRGTIAAEKDAHGRWLFTINPDKGQDTGEDILDHLRDRIAFLERQLENRDEEIRRRDHILLNLSNKIPQLEAPKKDPDQGDFHRVPWWRRWF